MIYGIWPSTFRAHVVKYRSSVIRLSNHSCRCHTNAFRAVSVSGFWGGVDTRKWNTSHIAQIHNRIHKPLQSMTPLLVQPVVTCSVTSCIDVIPFAFASTVLWNTRWCLRICVGLFNEHTHAVIWYTAQIRTRSYLTKTIGVCDSEHKFVWYLTRKCDKIFGY